MNDTAIDSDTPRNPPFMLIGIALAVGYWAAEAYIDTLLVQNSSYATRFFPSDLHELWMRGLAFALLIGFGLYVHRAEAHIRSTEMMKAQTDRDLRDALSRILSGYLPICAWCKKIRNREGEWEAPENFIATQTKTIFSHGMCPKCETQVLSPHR